jgi:hypothetical protein
MGNFLSLLRMALDRGWTLGGILAIFFGGILASVHYGIPVPAALQEWSAAGAIFGVAVLIVSLTSNVARGVGNLAKRWRFRRNTQTILRTLTKAEKEFLRSYILGDENTRYASIYDGVANGLQAKGIVYRASNISVPGTPGMLFPWNLQPDAREALNKNRSFLK